MTPDVPLAVGSDDLLRTAAHRRHDPLLSCLIEVARLHGRALTPDALIAGLPLPGGVLTPSVFRRAAARAGLASRVSRRPLHKIAKEMLPAILLLHDNDACTLLGWNADRTKARVAFSEAGQGEALIDEVELERRYAGFVIFARPRFRFDARTPEVGRVAVRHWFWGALWANRALYRDVLFAALVINVIALASPIFTMNVYDRVVPNRAVETLWALAAGLGVLLLWDFGLRMMRAYFVDLASRRVDISVSTLIMERVLGMRMEVRPPSVGSFAANLRAFESVRDFIASATVVTLVDVPFALLFVAVIWWLGTPLALAVIAGMVLLVLYAFWAQFRMHSLSETSFRAAAQRNATLIEGLNGLETIKAQGAEGLFQRKWEQSVAYLARIGTDLRLMSSSVTNGAFTVQQLVNIAIIVAGVYLIGENELTLGGLIAATMLASRAIMPLSQVAALLAQYHAAALALEALDAAMKQPLERPEDTVFVRRERFAGEIEFADVTFAYPGAEGEALRGVSFHIKAGERVAIIGRTGSGKSTINKLVMGLYAPTGGTIRIDGVDIRQLDPAELRRAIAYVPQEIVLFYGTLRENIALGMPYAEDEAIVNAMEVAGLRPFVEKSARGLDMVIGERGDSLSGGQRQAVAIARAFLHEPPMLVLDEPTSAMDFLMEQTLKAKLRDFARHRTLVLTTHRTSMMELADRLILLTDGKVTADGPRQQVLDLVGARIRSQ